MACRAVVVAQLAERSLPIPEVYCSNPVVGKKKQNHVFLLTVENTKEKQKDAVNGPLKTL